VINGVFHGLNQSQRDIAISSRFIRRIFIIDYFYRIGKISAEEKLAFQAREINRNYEHEVLARIKK